MKTWEMIRELSMDKKKTFKNSIGSVVGLNTEGILCWLKNPNDDTDIESKFILGDTLNWSNLNIEWQEVKNRKMVSVQEALTQLYNNNVRVLFELDGTLYEMGKLMHKVDIAAVIRGKWYIEEK